MSCTRLLHLRNAGVRSIPKTRHALTPSSVNTHVSSSLNSTSNSASVTLTTCRQQSTTGNLGLSSLRYKQSSNNAASYHHNTNHRHTSYNYSSKPNGNAKGVSTNGTKGKIPNTNDKAADVITKEERYRLSQTLESSQEETALSALNAWVWRQVGVPKGTFCILIVGSVSVYLLILVFCVFYWMDCTNANRCWRFDLVPFVSFSL